MWIRAFSGQQTALGRYRPVKKVLAVKVRTCRCTRANSGQEVAGLRGALGFFAAGS